MIAINLTGCGALLGADFDHDAATDVPESTNAPDGSAATNDGSANEDSDSNAAGGNGDYGAAGKDSGKSVALDASTLQVDANGHDSDVASDVGSHVDAAPPLGVVANLNGTVITYDDRPSANYFVSDDPPHFSIGARVKSSLDEFIIEIPNDAPGAYPCTAAGTMLQVTTSTAGYSAQQPVSSSSCTINVTSLGQQGQLVSGSFTGTMVKIVASNAGPDVLSVSGTFNVMRGADQ